jgi:hypothetical protein
MRSKIVMLAFLASIGCQEYETVDKSKVAKVLEANKPKVEKKETPYTPKSKTYVSTVSIEQFCETKVNDALTTCAKEGTIKDLSAVFDSEKSIQMNKCRILAKYRGRETAEQYTQCVESVCGKLVPSHYSTFIKSREVCDQRFT